MSPYVFMLDHDCHPTCMQSSEVHAATKAFPARVESNAFTSCASNLGALRKGPSRAERCLQHKPRAEVQA